jgi:hypothetical protein
MADWTSRSKRHRYASSKSTGPTSAIQIRLARAIDSTIGARRPGFDPRGARLASGPGFARRMNSGRGLGSVLDRPIKTGSMPVRPPKAGGSLGLLLDTRMGGAEWIGAVRALEQSALWESGRSGGVVTFTHFTCQPRCALKDRNEENQAVRGLEMGASSTENGLFFASVTMPLQVLAALTSDGHWGRSCRCPQLARSISPGSRRPS